MHTGLCSHAHQVLKPPQEKVQQERLATTLLPEDGDQADGAILHLSLLQTLAQNFLIQAEIPILLQTQ